jgi:hypothetical protein
MNLPDETALCHIIIWPHGMEHLPRILDSINSHPDVSILKTTRQHQPNLTKLISQTYAHDYAPIYHLRGKLSYLRKLNGDVMHLFAEIRNPQFSLTGRPGYRHYESRAANAMKTALREKYNPRLPDGSMSDQHIMHVSDDPYQALEMAKFLRFEKALSISGRATDKALGVHIPHHLKSQDELMIQWVAPSKLKANVWSGNNLVLMPLDETPHYLAITTQNQTIYDEYLAPRLGTSLKDGHSFQRLQSLLKMANANGVDAFDPLLVTQTGKVDEFQILDGVHRGAVATFLHASSVPVAVLGSS